MQLCKLIKVCGTVVILLQAKTFFLVLFSYENIYSANMYSILMRFTVICKDKRCQNSFCILCKNNQLQTAGFLCVKHYVIYLIFYLRYVFSLVLDEMYLFFLPENNKCTVFFLSLLCVQFSVGRNVSFFLPENNKCTVFFLSLLCVQFSVGRNVSFFFAGK